MRNFLKSKICNIKPIEIGLNMDTFEKMLKETNTLAKTCDLAVKDLKELKKDIKVGLPVGFHAEIYHRMNNPPRQKATCTMCVVGSIVRGFGLDDSISWALNDWAIRFIGQELDAKHIMYYRLAVIDELRRGVFARIFFFKGWLYADDHIQSVFILKTKNLHVSIRDIYEQVMPNMFDIEDYIKLYQQYAAFFKQHNI